MYPAAAPRNHDPQSWNGISYDSVVRSIERDLSDDDEDARTLVMRAAHPGHHAIAPARPVLPRISHTTTTTSRPAIAAKPNQPAKKRRWSLWLFVATTQIVAIAAAIVVSNPTLRGKTLDKTNTARARLATWIAPPSHAAAPAAVAPAAPPPVAQELPPAPAAVATCEAPAPTAPAAATATPAPTTTTGHASRHTTARHAAQGSGSGKGGDDVGEPIDPGNLLDRGLGASAP